MAADARLEFALAVRDPNCAATDGITRTETTVTGWTRNQTGMLSAAGGGHDPWDVTKYLNIWVANYTDGLLGKGSFPGMPPPSRASAATTARSARSPRSWPRTTWAGR